MTKRQKILRTLGGCAAVPLFVTWIWAGLLENKYVTWPRYPQPEIGRTIPYPVKGITVYITEYDQELNKWLSRALIGFGGVAAIFLIASGELQRIMHPERRPPQSN